jgi:hypothetical protein
VRKGAKLEFLAFDLTSPKDVLEKFRREIERFEDEDDREHSGDHLINAFTTGWHLHEWVWDAIRERPALLASVIDKVGLIAPVKGSKQFGSSLARKNQFLDVCRIVATSAKHVHVTLEKGSPQSVQTGFSYSSTRGAIGARPLSTRPSKWIAKVRIDANVVSASDLLLQIDQFWVELIYGCGVEARSSS